HKPGKGGMFEIRGIIDPRSQQYDRGMCRLPRREGYQVAMEDIGIFGYGAHIVPRYEIGKDALGDLPVLQHVAYPAGGAQVIFQNIKGSVLVADEIDAGDM